MATNVRLCSMAWGALVPLFLACGQSVRHEPAGADDTGGSAGSGGLATGGTSGTSGSSGTGAAPTDDRLLPLEVGRRWVYELSTLDSELPVKNCDGAREGTVPGTVTRDAESGWEYRPACAGVAIATFMNGDEIWGYLSVDSDRFSYAMPPVEEGATWDTGGGLMAVWRDEGTVSVPAGDFNRCWRRAWLPDEMNYIVLCRGVGMVFVHTPADNYELELSSKNF